MTINPVLRIRIFSIHNPDKVKQEYEIKHDAINASQ